MAAVWYAWHQSPSLNKQQRVTVTLNERKRQQSLVPAPPRLPPSATASRRDNALCPLSELVPWHRAMGKCARIDNLSSRQVWLCRRSSHWLPGRFWFPWSNNNNNNKIRAQSWDSELKSPLFTTLHLGEYLPRRPSAGALRGTAINLAQVRERRER